MTAVRSYAEGAEEHAASALDHARAGHLTTATVESHVAQTYAQLALAREVHRLCCLLEWPDDTAPQPPSAPLSSEEPLS